jgi:hypothetical protein
MTEDNDWFCWAVIGGVFVGELQAQWLLLLGFI